jgi:hypothetical protein
MLVTGVIVLVETAHPILPGSKEVAAAATPAGPVYTPLGSPEGQRLLRKPTGQLEAEIHSATLETRLAAAQATAEMYRKWYVEERDRHAPAEVVKKPAALTVQQAYDLLPKDRRLPYREYYVFMNGRRCQPGDRLQVDIDGYFRFCQVEFVARKFDPKGPQGHLVHVFSDTGTTYVHSNYWHKFESTRQDIPPVVASR